MGKSAASHFGATQLAAAKAAQSITVQCNKAQKRECDAVAVAASSEVSDAELAALTAAARHLRQAEETLAPLLGDHTVLYALDAIETPALKKAI